MRVNKQEVLESISAKVGIPVEQVDAILSEVGKAINEVKVESPQIIGTMSLSKEQVEAFVEMMRKVKGASERGR